MTDVGTKKEKKESSRDYWEISGLVFVTGGFRWGVSITGENVCMGKISGADISQDGTVPTPAVKKPVRNIVDGGFIPPQDNRGIMQQEKRGRGRPRKEGEVHRATTWRREKAKQGVPL